jgi:hypothetical protein
MANRRGWDALSPGYRQRLERKGISRGDYESGISIQAARGHAHTPERPAQPNIAAKFPQYAANRSQKIRDLEAKKQRVFGGSIRWDPIRSTRMIMKYLPTMRELDWALGATDQELYDAVREDFDSHKYLGYG